MDQGLYSAGDVARVVGITTGRLSYWVKTQLVTPSVKRSGRGLFCFEDLIAVKAAAELTARAPGLMRAVPRGGAAGNGATLELLMG